MCGDNTKNTSLAEILEVILCLQQSKNECCIDNSCSRPFLGPNADIICFNTRPITIYSCCNNTLWTMPYTLNDASNTSSVFRIESLDDECATFRILAPNPDQASALPYVSTDEFFTIKLSCIGAIKCLNDTIVNGI